jgi:predicted transcriptional regulator
MHLTLIAALAGYAPSDRLFLDALKSLKNRGFIETTTNTAVLTEAGSQFIILDAQVLTSDFLAAKIAQQLPRQHSVIFRSLFEKNGRTMTRKEIADSCGLDEKFLQKPLMGLERLALIARTGTDGYVCNDMLFID